MNEGRGRLCAGGAGLTVAAAAVVTLALALVLSVAGAGAQQNVATAAVAPQEARRTVRGVVFDDANGNGQRDEGERGVAGVSVSDQTGIATTAADGSYQLEAAVGAEVVFVSLPDGWTAPRGFWKPVNGVTASAEAGAQAETQAELNVNFALRREAKATEFTFIHASDTHLSPESLPRIRRLREIVERERPAFVLITGDLVRDALRVPEAEARGYYEMLVAELAQFPVPVWTVPGNHENFGIERHISLVSPKHPLYGKKMYQHFLGPNYYSFVYGGVRFVGLDTADIDDLWYYGHINAAQLEWLKRDLAGAAAGSAVVTFNHIPLATATEQANGYMEDSPAPSLIRVNGRMQYRHVVSNTAELLALLRPFRLEIALGGHMHVREAIAYQTEVGIVRFHQASAVVSNAKVAGMTIPSGVTLYRVRGGKIDDGTFIALDQPAAPRQ